MRCVFFGTPHFAVEILKDLWAHSVNIVAVVTKPDQPQGRSLKLHPSPVKHFLIENRIETTLFQPEKASDLTFIEQIKALKPDVFVVVGYGEILKKELLEIPSKAPINIHTSLLPAYRGAAPIQRAMMAKEKVMGITIMRMNPQMDAGQILLQKQFDVIFSEIFDQVEQKMIQLAQEGIKEVLSNLDYYQAHSKEQDIKKISKAPKIEVEDCLIDSTQTALTIQRQVMALSLKPGAFIECEFGGQIKRIKILRAELSSKNVLYSTIQSVDKELIMGCKDSSLQILSLQLEGKGVMQAKDFLNGYQNFLPIQIRTS